VEGDLAGAVATSRDGTARQRLQAVAECHTDIARQQACIPHDGERYRQGERLSTGCVASTVPQVLSQRRVQKPQLQWSTRGAPLLLQIRPRVWNGAWDKTFRTGYPGCRSHTHQRAA
jgi:hypothetical protein